MLGVQHLGTYIAGTVAVILLPGPNSMYVLSVASRFGIRSGYRAAVGVWLGDGLLMFLASVGVASVLEATPALFWGVKIAGGTYLGYLGFTMLRAALQRVRQRSAANHAASDARPIPPERLFRRAVTISLLNPKAVLFFVAFFVQFVDPQAGHQAVGFLTLATIAEIASALYLTCLIFGGRKLSAAFGRRARLSSGLTASVGVLFFAFAAKLVLS